MPKKVTKSFQNGGKDKKIWSGRQSMINSEDQYTSIIEEQSSNGTDEAAAQSSPTNPNELTAKQQKEAKDEDENPYGYRQPSPVILGTNPEQYISFTSAAGHGKNSQNRKVEANAMPEDIKDVEEQEEDDDDDISLSVIEIERQDSR